MSECTAYIMICTNDVNWEYGPTKRCKLKEGHPLPHIDYFQIHPTSKNKILSQIVWYEMAEKVML